ncbi:MAG: M15 family metallopeptidase [Prevotella sp.]|nr:M15 family metallopeptidase [Prevotella sp.]
MSSRRLSLILFWLCTTLCVQAQNPSDGFSVHEIPDSIWAKMQGRTWHPNPHVQRSDLRYLKVLHWDYDEKTHRGELVCNRLIADKLLAIFRELYAQHYPIQRIRLADEYDADDEWQMRDNNTSCFCYRNVPDTKKLSYHARGLAIDINTLYNPYVRYRKDGSMIVQPSNGKPYVDRKKDFRYKIVEGDLCHRLFLKHGFTWGGSWRTMKDYQHFEYHLK